MAPFICRHVVIKFDANPPETVRPTTRWGADPIQMKVGPITRAQAKRFKDNLAVFIQGISHSQEGLATSKEPRPVLLIQAIEAKTDPSDVFSANMEFGLYELDPHSYGFNSYGG